MLRVFIVAFVVVLMSWIPETASAQCTSLYDEDLNRQTWVVFMEGRYTLCYNAGYVEDSSLAQRWIHNAFDIGVTKYGVAPPVHRRGHDLTITIFLTPVPTSGASSSRATVTCCSDSVSLEIHIMSPSSPHYGRSEDDFIKVLTHEMMNTLHYESSEAPNIRPPLWIREGLAEYEGYYNTTPGNEAKVDWLLEYVYENKRSDIIYGRSLDSTSFSLQSLDRYYGSTVMMWFLAEHFGEGIHYELFQRPLTELLASYRIDVLSAFEWLSYWMDRKCETLEGCEAQGRIIEETLHEMDVFLP